MESDPPILLVDGVCNLCSGVVRFVADRERAPGLTFGSLQSSQGAALLQQVGLIPDALDTMVLFQDGQCYQRSDAAVRVAAMLRRPWSWLRVLRWLPRPLREAVYNLVARHRYRWFGRQEACTLPRPDLATRFLDDPTPPPAPTARAR